MSFSGLIFIRLRFSQRLFVPARWVGLQRAQSQKRFRSFQTRDRAENHYPPTHYLQLEVWCLAFGFSNPFFSLFPFLSSQRLLVRFGKGNRFLMASFFLVFFRVGLGSHQFARKATTLSFALSVWLCVRCGNRKVDRLIWCLFYPEREIYITEGQGLLVV